MCPFSSLKIIWLGKFLNNNSKAFSKTGTNLGTSAREHDQGYLSEGKEREISSYDIYGGGSVLYSNIFSKWQSKRRKQADWLTDKAIFNLDIFNKFCNAGLSILSHLDFYPSQGDGLNFRGRNRWLFYQKAHCKWPSSSNPESVLGSGNFKIEGCMPPLFAGEGYGMFSVFYF